MEQIIRQYGYYPLDSPIILPQTDYFRYLFFFQIPLIHRFPKQSAILDAFGTPSILRPDLRTSFLTYFGRCVNTTIRRYEFGTVFKAALGRGGDSTYQYSASIDNVWLQKYHLEWLFMIRGKQSPTGVLYVWEAILLSCHLLKTLSILVHQPLQLRINHVGVCLHLSSSYRFSPQSWNSMALWISVARNKL